MLLPFHAVNNKYEMKGRVTEGPLELLVLPQRSCQRSDMLFKEQGDILEAASKGLVFLVLRLGSDTL